MKRLKVRGFGLALALVISLGLVQPSFAVEVMRGGNYEDFAKDAPIATIHVDLSSATGIRLEQDTQPNTASPNQFFIDSEDSVQLTNVEIKYGFSKLNEFTLIYENAATTSTGEKKDVEIVFSNVELAGREKNKTYTDDIRLVNVVSANNSLSIRPQSKSTKRFGVRGEMKVRIGKAGDFTSDNTFFFSLYGINNARTGIAAYTELYLAGENNNYTEAVEQVSGIFNESNVYVPDNFKPSMPTGPNLHFLAVGGSDDTYETGYALTGEASGYAFKFWSNAGNTGFVTGLNLRILPSLLTHTSTSASGEGGKIELWTSGLVDDATATRLDGGTVSMPRLYTVPNGKTVTYKMTPDVGYEIDSLAVNGETVVPVEVKDGDGNILYYT